MTVDSEGGMAWRGARTAHGRPEVPLPSWPSPPHRGEPGTGGPSVSGSPFTIPLAFHRAERASAFRDLVKKELYLVRGIHARDHEQRDAESPSIRATRNPYGFDAYAASTIARGSEKEVLVDRQDQAAPSERGLDLLSAFGPGTAALFGASASFRQHARSRTASALEVMAPGMTIAAASDSDLRWGAAERVDHFDGSHSWRRLARPSPESDTESRGGTTWRFAGERRVWSANQGYWSLLEGKRYLVPPPGPEFGMLGPTVGAVRYDADGFVWVAVQSEVTQGIERALAGRAVMSRSGVGEFPRTGATAWPRGKSVSQEVPTVDTWNAFGFEISPEGLPTGNMFNNCGPWRTCFLPGPYENDYNYSVAPVPMKSQQLAAVFLVSDFDNLEDDDPETRPGACSGTRVTPHYVLSAAHCLLYSENVVCTRGNSRNGAECFFVGSPYLGEITYKGEYQGYPIEGPGYHDVGVVELPIPFFETDEFMCLSAFTGAPDLLDRAVISTGFPSITLGCQINSSYPGKINAWAPSIPPRRQDGTITSVGNLKWDSTTLAFIGGGSGSSAYYCDPTLGQWNTVGECNTGETAWAVGILSRVAPLDRLNPTAGTWSPVWGVAPTVGAHLEWIEGNMAPEISPIHCWTYYGLPECLLTSACMKSRGLPDDCEELETLRRFRDEVLSQRPEHRALVHQYYEVAPVLVRAVDAQPDAAQIYDMVYDSMVIPVLEAIRGDRIEEAVCRYRECATLLASRLGVEFNALDDGGRSDGVDDRLSR